MYYEMFRQMKKMLGQMDKWLDTASAHAKAKSFDPKKVSAALMADGGKFDTVKGPANWRQDHSAAYKYAAFLVKGKGAAERKNEWDLFTVEGSMGGESVLPTLKSLGY